MQTQSTIVREYANGMADGFLNDLAAGHISLDLTSENALVESFARYVGAAASNGGVIPSVAASNKPKVA